MAKKDKPKKDPLERLRNKLEKAGLKLNKDGTRIIGGGAGSFGSREQLELAQQEYRARASSFERQVGVDEKGEPIYETYTPVAFRTPESFTAYAAAARQNYLNPPEPAEDDGAGGEEEIGPQVPLGLGSSGFASARRRGGASSLMATLDQFVDQDLGTLSDTTSQLLAARRRKEAAQTFAGTYFNFEDFGGEEE